jgi:hypothetical protein
LDGQGQPKIPHDHGTINEALAASAEAFTDLPDRFELVNGAKNLSLKDNQLCLFYGKRTRNPILMLL